jgi:superfamily II DNA or RNA helicase/Fe2+ transport system protein FeoA
MPSFSGFLAALHPDIRMRGKQFEHFVKWFLKNDPEWATQVDQVWLWNDYPGQWGRDCGIDLVFKDKIGATWAVQAKCYSPDYEITKSDVDKFLSESNRKTINHRLLITTTDRIGANARQVLDGQEKSVVRYHLTHFENAAIDYPDSIERLSTGKRKSPPEARAHQIEAVNNVISGFQAANRGQLIMACGTGKTFVCLWVKEKLKAKRTLVLVPSLGLLAQILNDWTFAAREQFDALCVCSDQTVNRKDEDEPLSLVVDLAFPVSNDVSEITDFLKRDNDQVIFSTYQSSPLIAHAQKNADVPYFDLIVADEAHRCAGKVFSLFGTVLDAELIKSDRRLFSTATPRVYTTGLKKTAEESGVEVIDMSDEKSFGQRFHTLSFSEAINRNLLTDYRVLIVGVDDQRTREWIEMRLLVETDTGLSTDARSLAGQIGLLKAIKDWNLRRIISFHGRVRRAQEFSEEISQVAEWLSEDHKPGAKLWAEYVSGEMPTISRRQKLKRLKNISTGEIGLLSNARCLSEGVDVPALDGVAFVDPRSSKIDIIQSVGRAIRLSDNKTMGTIVLPVFIEQTENAEEALKASDFKPIWDVLEALKSHDDRLSNELDQLRIELGAKRKRSVKPSDLTKIFFDLPTSVNEDFAQALRTHLVIQTTEAWMFWYGLLEAYKLREGDCRVPYGYRQDGFRLGIWVVNQRTNATISDERRQKLDELGFIWDEREAAWEEGFSYLKIYKDRNGHCQAPINHKENGFQLGLWIDRQRQAKETMLPERRRRLDEVGFVWNPQEVNWEEGFNYLTLYKEREGNCRAPNKHIENGFRLGQWMAVQRGNKDKMSSERRQRLDDLGFVWNQLEADWEEGFSYLKIYKGRAGHCRVPQRHRENGFRLGQWVTIQRVNKDKISSERRRRLDELGFIWDPREADWEEGFSYLKIYKDRVGHCRVPQRHRENGFRLGQWVTVQRVNIEKISTQRRRRLDELGFIWDPREADWEDGLNCLKAYKKREGHCNVPKSHKENEFSLGGWVSEQRGNKDKVSSERIQRLDDLGFVWNPLEAAWENGFSYLTIYKNRNGHCRVPKTYKENGFELGSWVSVQRANKSQMSLERRQRLNELGFVWKPQRGRLPSKQQNIK